MPICTSTTDTINFLYERWEWWCSEGARFIYLFVCFLQLEKWDLKFRNLCHMQRTIVYWHGHFETLQFASLVPESDYSE